MLRCICQDYTSQAADRKIEKQRVTCAVVHFSGLVSALGRLLRGAKIIISKEKLETQLIFMIVN